METFDVVVIGSGPGGYAAAIRCAQKKASVAVIEKDVVGGTCLNCGCVPSKALLASAHTLLTVARAQTMGIQVGPVSPDWQKIQARKDAIVAGLRKGLAGLLQANKIKVIAGSATVISPGRVRIEASTGSTEVRADKIILATGSVPVELPSVPFDGEVIISSTEALQLAEIPRSMLIVGGGAIGCEFACIYAPIGTKVTIVEALATLLPKEDDWAGRVLSGEFKKMGITVLTGQTISAVEEVACGAKVTLATGQVVEAEKVLVAVGRKPACDNETINALGLKINPGALPTSRDRPGAIAVNDRMETSAPGVYAIGDAVGTTYLAHGAFAEAEVAAENATGRDRRIGDYGLIPRAVYTFPEVAAVGKTYAACVERQIPVTVGRAFFRANARSAADNQTVGEVRVVRDKSTNRILSVTIVGVMATELITAARALIGSAEDICKVSFPHPTVCETLKEAIEDAFGVSLHLPPPQGPYRERAQQS